MGTQSAIQRPCLGLVRKNICDLMCTFIQYINTILETKTEDKDSHHTHTRVRIVWEALKTVVLRPHS